MTDKNPPPPAPESGLKAKLREATNVAMSMLEQNPQPVIAYFKDLRVRYAA